MCGILFAVSSHEAVVPSKETLRLLRARGPDCVSVYNDQVNPSDQNRHQTRLYLTFASSVLSLRGSPPCPQPIVDSATGSVFCWNGEAWRVNVPWATGALATATGMPLDGNDTQIIFNMLLRAAASDEISFSASAAVPGDNTERGVDLDQAGERIVKVLTSIAGPFAFVFFDKPRSHVYYGRDWLGRRSLTTNTAPTNDLESKLLALPLVICSFDPGSHNSKNNHDDNNDRVSSAVEVPTGGVFSLDLNNGGKLPQLLRWPPSATLQINKSGPHSQLLPNVVPDRFIIDELLAHLSQALQLRVLDIPTLNVTPSLLTPPTKVAILFSGGLDCTLLARICHDVLPIDEPIDLLNVAFENPRTTRAAVDFASSNEPGDAPASASPYELCPDRVTGRASFKELTDICVGRRWRFIAVDIPYPESQAHRAEIIRLMAPHNTEMDLSITMALYFAARGQGSMLESSSSFSSLSAANNGRSQPYTTTARVLLSGLGADELFGGYSRHAVSFKVGGYQGLNDELELDFDRIGKRNLGRDDRVIAHWAREVRYPYLDEGFVRFALNLSAWDKCGFRPERAIPKHDEHTTTAVAHTTTARRMEDLDAAKLLLRCATWKLGMQKAAGYQKRAIQFGARTAKMRIGGGKTKGTDIVSPT